ncbi:hypothetical protein IE81DRAFT_26420 [Ceraceosorus guamensis]|uniref:LTV-domain-containing protein n=1 Tax=Ceraceosorus guamensis TaxID=1522189 RepID=A0A316VQ13_9BASI|nr:hypothetical protein IE81DRAFT_26420 [Ceraceosorus guamensis]PWN39420.1 hypothetical protein IE81DRAFT_26420 [Ceraceosorus guamensis]
MGSKFRGPSSQKFQLVHRSQRDPLINDEEAGTHVWSSISSSKGPRSGKTRADLELELDEKSKRLRGNVGEAAKYGVYFDDTEYDYMQHLRSIGGDYNAKRGGKDEEEDVDVVLLPAPKSKQQQQQSAAANATNAKAKGKAIGMGIELREDVEARRREEEDDGRLKLSKDMLPPEHLPNRDWSAGFNVAQDLKGLQPDMDPHLRQVLEALDDDAFLLRTAGRKSIADATELGTPGTSVHQDRSFEDEQGEEEDLDEFFADIIEGGELSSKDEVPEWRALPPEGDEAIREDPAARAARELLDLKATGQGPDALSLESRVALFKAAQKSASEDRGQNRHLAGLRPGGVGPDTIGSDEEEERSSVIAPSQSSTLVRANKARRAPSSVGSQSIFGEKGASRKSRNPGAKARLAASYYAPSAMGGATAFSMSSSAMERNQGLTDLDMQFDKLEALYEQNSDDEEEDEDDDDEQRSATDVDSSVPKDLSREDFDQVIDEFLSTQEVYGGKLKERLGGLDLGPVEKLGLFRKELGRPLISRREELEGEESESESEDEPPMPRSAADDRDKWDVETVLSTRTNLENHPRLINAATSVAGSSFSHRPQTIASSGIGSRPSRLSGSSAADASVDRIPKIKIDPRTGMPSISRYITVGAREARRKKKHEAEENLVQGSTSSVSPPSSSGVAARSNQSMTMDRRGNATTCLPEGSWASVDEEEEEEEEQKEGYESDATETGARVTITRDRNESAEEKKARKAAAKEFKQNRKAEKANRKAAYVSERKAQSKSANGRIDGGGAADVGRNGVGSAGSVVRLA